LGNGLLTMKQIIQSYKSGELWLAEVPVPACRSGGIVMRNMVSFVSAGTERMLVDFARKNIIGKALAMPDQVKKVLGKMKTEGIFGTLEKVQAKLDQPIPLGYSCAGAVEEVGRDVPGLSRGDRVACGGAGYANHAEFNYVPKNLVAKIPENVSFEDASCATVGSIALQGVRQCDLRLGENVCVIGLGLLGLLAVQLLKAGGARVIGYDPNGERCKTALELGSDVAVTGDLEAACRDFSEGRGVDAVLITAATRSNDPVTVAGEISRIKGKVVVTGMVGMEIPRDQYYKKELDFKLSLSYGPGRYDPGYEEAGHDYPYGYVRWTERRNIKAFLDLVAAGKVTPSKLITHRFDFEKALDAYELLLGKSKEPYLGIILEYQMSEVRGQRSETDQHTTRISVPDSRTVILKSPPEAINLRPQTPVIGMIGAGNFTGQVLLPALRDTGARLKSIASAGGVSGTHLAKKFGFELSTTNGDSVIGDPEINTVFITTRHNTHASYVIEALKAGKHVFVEKPLCLTNQELEEIMLAADSRRQPQIFPPDDSSGGKLSAGESNNDISPSSLLMAGFNRRFAPHVVKMKELLNGSKEPRSMVMTVNAGHIPPEHWTQDPKVGGGRIVGEACHFVDLLRFLAGASIEGSEIFGLDSPTHDTVSIQLKFADGSMGTIHYFANGNGSFPKERLEVFCGGKILQLDNFRMLRGYGWKGFKSMRLWGQDKGHGAEIKAFVEAVQKGGPSPIPFEEIVEVTRTTIDLVKYH
jgi:predicted dehydrogenase/threonine dehydrogenase-like Zn-dependent dehydrogenase